MTFEEVQEKAIRFRDDRDWRQFHNPKDLAISLSLEAAELLECFQWSADDLVVPQKHEAIADELADILNCCLLMSDVLEIDLLQSLNDKIDRNAKKYPIEKSKGSAAKYTEL